MSTNDMDVINFTIPFLTVLSKNRRSAFKGNKMKNPEHAAAQDLVSYKFKKELMLSPEAIKGKCLVQIIAYKPNMRFDCINLVNPICDALKVCLDFDDNYFACNADWAIDKKNPRIEIFFLYNIE